MGDLTKNLSRKEFACRCGCGYDTVDFMLVKFLQETVNHFSQLYGDCTIHITSGNRCEAHNATIKGAAKDSQHIYGRAGDFKIKRPDGQWVEAIRIYAYLAAKYGNKISLGLYHNRIHVDSRQPGGARWNTTDIKLPRE